MGLYLGLKWYPRWAFQSWVAKFPGVVVGFFEARREFSPWVLRDSVAERERLWKACQMQWIIRDDSSSQ